MLRCLAMASLPALVMCSGGLVCRNLTCLHDPGLFLSLYIFMLFFKEEDGMDRVVMSYYIWV